MAEEKHRIRTSIIASLATAAITALVQFLIPGGWAAVFSMLTLVVRAIFGWLGSSISIPIWCFCLLVFFSLTLLLIVWLKIRKATVGFSELEYREDWFDSLIWRWSYTPRGQIRGTTSFCPHCDTVLVYREELDFGSGWIARSTRTHFTCERCHEEKASLEGSRDSIVARIERQIDRKIRVGEWRAVVEKQRTTNKRNA